MSYSCVNVHWSCVVVFILTKYLQWPVLLHFSFLQGWLVDLVNKFGALNGFSILQERVCKGGSLSVPLLAALLRYKWTHCYVLSTTNKLGGRIIVLLQKATVLISDWLPAIINKAWFICRIIIEFNVDKFVDTGTATSKSNCVCLEN